MYYRDEWYPPAPSARPGWPFLLAPVSQYFFTRGFRPNDAPASPVRARVRARTHARAHAHALCAGTRACTRVHAHARTRTRASCTRTHAHAPARVRTCTRTHAHASAHTRACTHLLGCPALPCCTGLLCPFSWCSPCPFCPALLCPFSPFFSALLASLLCPSLLLLCYLLLLRYHTEWADT